MSRPTSHTTSRTFCRAVVTVLGLMALAAGSASARSLAPGPAAGKFVGGFTSQGWPVVARVSSTATSIQKVRTGLNFTCTLGDNFQLGDGWIRLPVAKDGRVNAVTAIPPSAGPPGSGESLTGGTDSLSGKLNRRLGTFSGVWHMHLNFGMSNGQTDSCDSGHVTFTAGL